MMKRHRQPLVAQDAINVTNLLDTAFILLVTFMLVTPQLAHSIKVKLPEVTKTSTPTPPGKQPIIIIIQKKQGSDTEEHVYLKVSAAAKESQVDLATLRAEIENAKKANADLNVVIQPDKDASTGITVKVLAAIREANVDNIGISVNPERAKETPTPRGR